MTFELARVNCSIELQHSLLVMQRLFVVAANYIILELELELEL